MELRHIQYAVAVAEEQHFSRAAARLHVAQSALSSQIRDLERELGVELFSRTSRSVTVTDAGRVFLERAYGVLGSVSRLVADVSPSTTEVRRLRVGMIVPLTRVDVVAAVASLTASHPNMAVSLLPRGSAITLDGVSDGSLDVGIVGLAPGRTHTGLTSTALWTEPLSLFVAAEHEWARRRSVRLVELDGMTMIDRPAGSEARMQTDYAFTQSSVPRGTIIEADSSDIVAGLTESGLGVTLLPTSLASLFPRLHRIDVVDAPTRTVSVVTNPSNTTSVTAAFTDYLLRQGS
ncbi:LysR family transcriptional regulator [Rhodococcus sp. Eu-32]|uniref:LysR family transcriptional regulator n=1 Tax=Rhodococcus sp. Eu-32 TaxID=1017319 RepID=UPI000DF3605C|nr:LysR family transcriptional regulator [Rhodococcus sp. Eu-32]RRQ28400.1 LysR family transcriptional regulator [Rhodococcus sp. Eu-32]